MFVNCGRQYTLNHVQIPNYIDTIKTSRETDSRCHRLQTVLTSIAIRDDTYHRSFLIAIGCKHQLLLSIYIFLTGIGIEYYVDYLSIIVVTHTNPITPMFQ